jgi:integrase
MRKTLTDKGVAALKPRAQRYAFPDPELVGHYVRIQPTGAKAYWTVARSPAGKQVWTLIAATDIIKIDAARDKAREAIRRVRAGLSAVEQAPTVPAGFQAVAEQWLKRHVQAKGLRSESELRRFLNQYVYPTWKDRPFLEIRRSDVAALLDTIEDKYGARAADHVLATVRSIFNWYATRADDYVPPIARGMRRTSPKERARERTLTDDELRALWQATESSGTFGAFVRLLLLTAQRRAKVVSMRWDDINSSGTWTIPAEAREKGNAGALGLPTMARSIIDAQPRLGNNPFVFAGRGDGYVNGYSKAKVDLDGKLPADMPQWQLHDLRRTARSLMSRAGVRPDIAERVLGHVIGGVEGVYDRHKYDSEKADALERLASLVDSIVNPREDNVVQMVAREAQ